MLPQKIKQIVLRMTEKTDNGELTWSVDKAEDIVRLDQERFSVKLNYLYDTDMEKGYYNFYYYDKTIANGFPFLESSTQEDYLLLDNLYKVAQASVIKNPFED
jgi:hypothetical protein